MSEPMSEGRYEALTWWAQYKGGILQEAKAEIDRLAPIAAEAEILRAEKEALQRELIAARERLDVLRDTLASNGMRNVVAPIRHEISAGGIPWFVDGRTEVVSWRQIDAVLNAVIVTIGSSR